MQRTLKWRVAQYCERLWWRVYLKNKTKNDYLAWKTGYWQQFLQKLVEKQVPIDTAHTILDAGCGPAGIFTVLSVSKKITAIDPLLPTYSSDLVHFSPSDYPNVDFKALTLENFEETAHYDLAFCTNAINHVSDLDKSLHNLVTSIKKGGYLVISIDAHKHSFLKKILRCLPADILHPHQYDLAEYKSLLQKHGVELTGEFCQKKESVFDYWVLVGRRAA